jgi:hypothetical protein
MTSTHNGKITSYEISQAAGLIPYALLRIRLDVCCDVYYTMTPDNPFGAETEDQLDALLGQEVVVKVGKTIYDTEIV